MFACRSPPTRFVVALCVALAALLHAGIRSGFPIVWLLMSIENEAISADSSSSNATTTTASNHSGNHSSQHSHQHQTSALEQGLLLSAYAIGQAAAILPLTHWIIGRCQQTERHRRVKSSVFYAMLFAVAVLCLQPTLVQQMFDGWRVADGGGVNITAAVVLSIVGRMAVGAVQAIIPPALLELLCAWLPDNEVRPFGVLFVAHNAGIAVAALAVAAVLPALDWSLVFYMPAMLCGLLATGWLFLVFDGPANHPRCAAAEREHIAARAARAASQTVASTTTPLPTVTTTMPTVRVGTKSNPSYLAETQTLTDNSIFKMITRADTTTVFWPSLRRLWQAPTFWAALLLHVGNAFGSSLVLNAMPFLVHTGLRLTVGETAAWVAVMFASRALCALLVGQVAERLLAMGCCGRAAVRKAVCVISHTVPGIFWLAAALCDDVHRPHTSLACLWLGFALNGCSTKSAFDNLQDLAPRHLGAVHAIVECVAAATSASVPLVVARFVGAASAAHSAAAWRPLLCTAAALFAGASLVFLVCGSAAEQPWTGRRRSPPVTTTGAAEPGAENPTPIMLKVRRKSVHKEMYF